jgi:acetyl-CoA synthetase
VPTPDWIPTTEFIATTNVAWLMQRVGAATYDELHAWSIRHRAEFWKLAIERLDIRFAHPWHEVMDLSRGVESPQWFPGAQLNVVESCFLAPAGSPAILHQAEGGPLLTMSVAELQALTGRVAANLRRLGFQPGDALAIFMPMTAEAVAIYLGIVAAGCVVVGIADSFRPREVAARLRIARAVGLFTQDVLLRGGKEFPLYAGAVEAGAPRTIVVPARENGEVKVRAGDLTWRQFLEGDGPLEVTPRDPADNLNTLFSSGTTGEPKAIPWMQVTPLKCAVDAHFHLNIQPGDVVAWPTNLGWMMGPFLIFASLMNRAAMALFQGAPTGREFGQFVQSAGTTALGLVPSLVRAWRNSGCLEGLDWTGIKVFGSTGECSRADDMRWLMQFAGGRPMIEYCGGTEIGGAYITSTVARPNVAGLFNTPALGLDVVIVDEDGHPAQSGEAFIVPPSIGLSNSLLNKDHHDIYFAGTPSGPHGETLRRHGDQMERLPGGYWRALGRADDTMNLGGIKVSSAEIEQTLRAVPGVIETAAIAVSPDGGPSQLVIYAVCSQPPPADKLQLLANMQAAIKRDLNPLFKIHDVVLIESLPRTASNKVLRRDLRTRYSTKN